MLVYLEYSKLNVLNLGKHIGLARVVVEMLGMLPHQNVSI